VKDKEEKEKNESEDCTYRSTETLSVSCAGTYLP